MNVKNNILCLVAIFLKGSNASYLCLHLYAHKHENVYNLSKTRGPCKIANDVFPSEKSLLLKFFFFLILDETYFRAHLHRAVGEPRLVLEEHWSLAAYVVLARGAVDIILFKNQLPRDKEQ